MIKVATLSFQHAYNYGAVFQVAALQHVIQSLGTQCDIIDYRCPAIDRQYDFKPLHFDSKIFSAIRANLVLVPFIKSKKKNFQKWMDSYQCTEIITKEHLPDLDERYDKFVVGSDQVWNMKCQGHDTSFFLDFVSEKSKKLAYAASFGTYNIFPEDTELFKKYLSTFNYISVRENRGQQLVKELSGRSSQTCLDPVLLAGRRFWESRMDNNFQFKNKYIFVYQLGHSNQIPKFVKQLKKHFDFKVVFVTGHAGNMIYYSPFDKNESSVSPERFLSYLANASVVVTNSFHATAFSILFQKNFYVISKGGMEFSSNARIYNLLNSFGLSDRILYKYEESIVSTPCDYSIFTKKIEDAKNDSLDYLKTAIGLYSLNEKNS